MTREEARKAADIMLAYADGKKIEWKDRSGCRNSGEWVPNKLMHFNWENNDYRIKSEPKYRSFNSADECWNEMQKHTPFGWIQEKEGSNIEDKIYIISVNKDSVSIGDYDGGVLCVSYSSLLAKFVFIDGAPIGLKE